MQGRAPDADSVVFDSLIAATGRSLKLVGPGLKSSVTAGGFKSPRLIRCVPFASSRACSQSRSSPATSAFPGEQSMAVRRWLGQ